MILLNYKKDGTPFWNELRISPVKNETGEITNFIGIQNDITRRVTAEEALRKAKEQAEHVSKLKTDFLNVISHELRTPLTVMLGNIPLLTDVDDMPEIDEIVEIATDIEDAGDHLMELINELLDISRIEEGKLTLTLQALSAMACVSETVETMSILAEKKGLNLDIEQGSIDFQFMGDALRIKQILMNLVGNAIKFTNAGSISIRISTENSNGLIVVTDTGSGIEEKHLPHIFEVFRQVDGSATRRASGSGLGLAISQKLMELHHGLIEVQSVWGEGSSFTLSLPLGTG